VLDAESLSESDLKIIEVTPFRDNHEHSIPKCLGLPPTPSDLIGTGALADGDGCLESKQPEGKEKLVHRPSVSRKCKSEQTALSLGLNGLYAKLLIPRQIDKCR
jgi:hypothetical protein